MAGRYDGNWTKKPGLLSHDTKTALSSDNIVIHRQVPIEGTVLRFVEEIEPPFLREHTSHSKVWSLAGRKQ